MADIDSMTPSQRFLKRALDVAASLAGLLVLLVPGALIALAIRLSSPGPGRPRASAPLSPRRNAPVVPGAMCNHDVQLFRTHGQWRGKTWAEL